MKFTVDAKIMMIKQYRLGTDGEYRRLSRDRSINPADLVFEDINDTVRFTQLNTPAFIGGMAYTGNASPQRSNAMHTYATIEPIVHRNKVPRKFSQDEVRLCIAETPEDAFGVLCLDLEGHVRMITEDLTEPQRDLSIAVYSECMTEGYLGREASQDNSHVRDSYMSLLDNWRIHLITGRLHVYADMTPNESEESIWSEIDSLTKDYSA
jgi:hypothetical protein